MKLHEKVHYIRGNSQVSGVCPPHSKIRASISEDAVDGGTSQQHHLCCRLVPPSNGTIKFFNFMRVKWEIRLVCRFLTENSQLFGIIKIKTNKLPN